jgi:DNA-3-methyladenine glycosylase
MDKVGLNSNLLGRSFFQRDTLQVARDLLGAKLVRDYYGQQIAGIIIETEAYIGKEDLGCHASRGKTARNEVMFGEAGRAYVYFTYGMHWLLNVVTEEVGFPAAVLIRAIHPVEGEDLIAQKRGSVPRSQWTNGPAKLCQALGIDGSFNGCDLCSPSSLLRIERGVTFSDDKVQRSARIGLFSVPQPWKDIPWRFYVSTIY